MASTARKGSNTAQKEELALLKQIKVEQNFC